MCKRLNMEFYIFEVAFKEPVTILATLITMLVLSPQLTLFVLIILPVSGYIIGRIGKTLKRTSTKITGAARDY